MRQIGVKNGYTMVMEKGNLLWATPSTDITDDVIRNYDATKPRPERSAQLPVKPPPHQEAANSVRARERTFGCRTPPPRAPAPAPSDEGRSTISK